LQGKIEIDYLPNSKKGKVANRTLIIAWQIVFEFLRGEIRGYINCDHE